MSDFPPGGGGMWEPDQFTRPLGVPVEGGVSASDIPLGGERAAITPPPSSASADVPDLQARLHALVMEMRRRQPMESQWLDHPELRRLRSDVDHLTVIVEMCVELVLTAAEREAA